MNQAQITKLAQKVRREFEKKWPNQKLTGACTMASFELKEVLAQNDIEANLVKGRVRFKEFTLSHTWLEVEGQVVDITATQFNFRQKVFIFSQSKKAEYGYIANKD